MYLIFKGIISGMSCPTHMFYVLTLFTQQQQQQQQQCIIIYLIYHGIISECLIVKKTESV